MVLHLNHIHNAVVFCNPKYNQNMNSKPNKISHLGAIDISMELQSFRPTTIHVNDNLDG